MVVVRANDEAFLPSVVAVVDEDDVTGLLCDDERSFYVK